MAAFPSRKLRTICYKKQLELNKKFYKVDGKKIHYANIISFFQ